MFCILCTAPTTTVPSTTGKVCDENLDTYAPVTVSRTAGDGSAIGPDDFWLPDSNPFDPSDPYSAPKLTLTFDPQSEIRSVTVYDSDGSSDAVVIAIKSKSTQNSPLEDLLNDSGGNTFESPPGSAIVLPNAPQYAEQLDVHIVNPSSNRKYQVRANGCEHAGKYSNSNNGPGHVPG